MRSEKIFNQNKNASMPTMSRPSAKQAIPTIRVTLRAFLMPNFLTMPSVGKGKIRIKVEVEIFMWRKQQLTYCMHVSESNEA